MSDCNQFNVHEWNSDLCFNCFRSRQDHQVLNLPYIYILGTGGTIAGVASDENRQGSYQAGVLDVNVLLQAVPGLSKVARIGAEQIANIDSKDMTTELWNKLAQRICQLLTSDRVDGIVITHGTDTLEETAYFLYLTLGSNKPIVLTAAMRPSNAVSPDGPANLLNAVVVAASRASVGQSVLVVMNNQIYSARDVTKTNTYSVDTFRSNEFGALGYIQGTTAIYQRSIAGLYPTMMQSSSNDNEWAELPSVEIVTSYAGPSRATIDALVQKGVKGLVIAGTGDGTIHNSLEKAALDAVEKGIAVVRASRVSYGHVTHDQRDDQVGFLSAGTLNPWKARILLMLILARNIVDHAARQHIFDKY